MTIATQAFLSARTPLALLAATLGARLAHAQACGTMQDLGVSPGYSYSWGFGTSSDGSVVVGSSSNTTNMNGTPRVAWRWTAANGLESLVLPGWHARASGVSASGTVIVGSVDTTGVAVDRPFRWTVLGVQTFGVLQGGLDSYANSVSRNGLVSVGFSGASVGVFRATSWSETGQIRDLGSIPGYPTLYYRASNTNVDGSVIVGYGAGVGVTSRAFRWTESSGMQDLGSISNASTAALDVSADGEVVVGSSGDRAFRWTRSTGMQDLGQLAPGAATVAYGVSDDGSTIVGKSGNQAFIWRASQGMRDIGSLTPGAVTVAFDVSGDGRVVVGQSGTHAFRWVECDLCPGCAADYDANGGVDGADLAAFFADYEAGTGCADVDLNGGVDGADLATFFVLYEVGGC